MIRRAIVATLAVGAVVAGGLTVVQSTQVPMIASLGTSVDGRAATPVVVAADARSSRTAASVARSVPSGTYDVTLTTSAWHPVGSTGIELRAKTTPTGTRVHSAQVAVENSTQAARRHITGLAVDVHRTDGASGSAPVEIKVPKSLLTSEYGADFAARARWMTLPSIGTYSSKTSTPTSTAMTSNSVVLTPKIAARTMTLAATSTPVAASGTGSFSATSLKPASTWNVSAQTGDFSWQYPITSPPAAAGPTPGLSLSYNSQAVDGETGSTNNQPSAVGDGWDLAGGGFIERQYVACSQDDGASGAVTTSGDLCWKTDNATLNLGGQSSALVRDSATGMWKLQSDDGSRLQHLVGTADGCRANGTYDTDCWLLTTTDGTKYYFGLNELPNWAAGNATTNSTWTVPVFGNDTGEPCHAAGFADSSCVQAWRWNLDYVVDSHNNAEAFYYDTESNNYGKNGSGATSYIRGGQLDHIDYGIVGNAPYAATAASGKITFGYDAYGRCSDASHSACTSEAITAAPTKAATPTAYPDVPWDQFCISSCADNPVPTFWTDAMLDTITTSVKSGSSYSAVDKWTLSHSFPAPGDGTSAALWLTQVQHTGYSGSTTLTEPATKFAGTTMQNRVWPTDGLAPLDKWRLSSITAATGAVTSVNYSAQQCTADRAAAIEAAAATNSERCYPQWWVPSIVPAVAPQEDLFHKYVVTSVINDPKTGGGDDPAQETDYVYTGTPAWKYNTSPFTPDKQRTWSVYAGYNTVEVRAGASSAPSAQQATDYTFYQGTDGDRASTSGGTKAHDVTGTTVTDSAWFAGQVYERKVLNGVGGTVVSDTINTPWASDADADDGLNTARIVEDGDSSVTEPTSTGTRTTSTATTYNAFGDPLTVVSASTDAGTTCTRTTYAPANTDAWIIDLPQEVVITGTDCNTAASSTNIVSDVRTYYDSDATFGGTPTKGDVDRTDTATAYSGSTPNFALTNASSYDALGRVLSSKDGLGRATSTAYTPSGAGPVTSVIVTDPLTHKTTTTYDGTRGNILTQTGIDGGVTTATYDALGRRISVWLPGHPQASYASSPSTTYAYTETQTAPLAVETTTLNATASNSTFALYDGLGQQVQTQAPSPSGGSIVTDEKYDSQGRVVLANNSYWASGSAPSVMQFVPANQQQIQSSTATIYDADGRTTATITRGSGVEKYRTSYAYPGADEVDASPPSGGVPTSTFTNSLGEKTKLEQYLGATPSGAGNVTTYGYDAAGNMTSMTDPAQNVWTWSYDLSGNQTSANDPDSGATTSTYDIDGELTSTTDARGQVLSYAYDAGGRKTAEYAGPASSGGSLLDAWTYDTVQVGQMSSKTSYTGSTAGKPGLAYTTTYSAYNLFNEPTSEKLTVPTGAPAFGGTSYQITHGYAFDGSETSTTYPAMGGIGAERVVTSHDAIGNVSGASGLSTYGTVTYNAINQIAQIDRLGTVPNYTAYSYDTMTGAIIGIQDQTGTSSSTKLQATRTYARNKAGTITSAIISGAAGAETQCYTYDAMQEITAAWTPSSGNCASAPTATTLGGAAPYWHSYSYDLATGNRLSETDHATSSGAADTVSKYSYPAATAPHPHAVQNVTTSTGASSVSTQLTYDAVGDTTGITGQTLAYDAEGKVQTITKTSTSQKLGSVYDADGDLLLQSDPVGGSTLFIGATELHQQTSTATVTASRTYSINGTPIAERDTNTAGTATVYLLDADIDGTVDLESVSTSGATTRRWLDPFGKQIKTSAAWSGDRAYLNKSTSSFTTLTQVGARVLDTALGRFLSVDPVFNTIDPRQDNGYAYSANDPVTFADPSGLCRTDQDVLTHQNHCAGGIGYNAPGAGALHDSDIHYPPAPGATRHGNRSQTTCVWGGNCGAGTAKTIPYGAKALGATAPRAVNQAESVEQTRLSLIASLSQISSVSDGLFAACLGIDSEDPYCGAFKSSEWLDVIAARAALRAAASGEEIDATELTAKGAANYKRFLKKVPAGADKANSTVTRYADGSIRYSVDVPGRVPGSWAVYDKITDDTGETIAYWKTSYTPDGTVVHVKGKFNG